MYDFSKIEKKWQKKWEESKIFKVKEDSKKDKFYCLEMYPYPSEKLHVGHLRNYSIGDCFSRYKRMRGFNVLYPMGYDAFGLPAENAAIKNKVDPEKWTRANIETIKKQQQSMGLSYDWDRQIQSCDKEYYKWNQWIFLKFYENKLAYREKAYVNWCPECNTVLANEQVHDGKCWRCHSEVKQEELEQWFFNIRKYADELLEGLKDLEWPERVKIMQENWIGKSHGTIIDFTVKDTKEKIPIFTTRCDTIYGVTFMVFAPEHPTIRNWVKGTKYEKEFDEFSKDVQKEDKFKRTSEEAEKKGMFIGKMAINPLTGEEIPIYVGNFVVYEYGAGAVMAVPAHDQRDFNFANKYDIPIKVVIQPEGYEINSNKMSRAFLENGHLVDSGVFSGMNNREAIKKIGKKLKELKKGGPTINYKLRDWLISRQRYWGTPIPIIYCEKCGAVPVPEKDLPVKLPKDIKFTGTSNPLTTSKSFIDCKCPKCNGKAKRDTDTMDTFVDSSWYFLRYCDSKNNKLPFGKSVDYWMPVDQYIGGIEHAIMHLLYARFFTKALRDLGLHKINEPFKNLLCQGMIIKDGAKMSKSLGNVVDPKEIIDKYGADTARIFILFTALPEKELDWDDKGIDGSFRFLNRINNLIESEININSDKKLSNRDKNIVSYTNKTIKKVTELVEGFKLSLAIGAIMEFVNHIYKYKEETVNKQAYDDAIKSLILMLNPFTPHIAEELWEKIGCKGFVSSQQWPEYDEKKIDEKAEASELVISNTVADINSVLNIIEIKEPKKITLIISPKWKYLFFKIFKKELEKTREIKNLISICMAETELKKYGKDISKMIPGLLKDISKVPKTVLDQSTEMKSLSDAKKSIGEEFSCNIEIIESEKSQEAKARVASPGKPSIVIE
jgi:leucyl-tRNA synthetase